VRDVTSDNFGLLVAYLLPGFVALWGVSFFSETVASWLRSSSDRPTVGGFLYATIGSIAAGLAASTVRWLLIDRLHHATGLSAPNWDFERLEEKLRAFRLLVESHYRYYQFYSNTIVALAFAYGAWKVTNAPFQLGFVDLSVLVAETVLFTGSRDTLRKYYVRGNAILRQ
jgi:hypothetical protein